MANNFRVKALYAESIKVNSRPTVNGTGVALSGDNAATVTNGVYLTGNQNISGVKTFLTGVNISGNLAVSGNQYIYYSGVQPLPILPNNPFTISASGNSYIQSNYQNRATGNNASMDFVITTSDGTDSTNYLNIGLNNSGYNQSAYSTTSGYDGYMYIHGGNLAIGTQTSGKNIIFHAGGTTIDRKIAEINYSGMSISGDLNITGNFISNGTGNLLPFQTVSNSGSILTRSLADDRFSNRSVRVTGDTISHSLEQFVDFVENYTNDLTISTAAGSAAAGAAPSVFGDIWNAGNANISAFWGNDLYAHKGIYLYRGHNAGTSGSMVFQLNRPTTTHLGSTVTGISRLFTARLFLPADVDFTGKGYFKIGPCQKGGTGGANASLGGGLMFNPYVSPNLIIGVYASGVASPYTFTTVPAQINYIDTNLPYSGISGRWVNFSYKTVDAPSSTTLYVDIVRENISLFSTGLNMTTLQSSSGWVNAYQLRTAGASAEIGINFGKLAAAVTRSEIFMDYIYYNATGSYSLPSNWNSLRF